MGFKASIWLRGTAVVALYTALSWFSGNAFALPTHELIKNQWSLISLPADPGSDGTVELLFGDDLPVDEYGPENMWLIVAHDASAGRYINLELTDTLKPNVGYWAIQVVEDSIELDLPDTLAPLAGSTLQGCPEGKLCSSRPLVSGPSDVQWNLAGYSSEAEVLFGETRFSADNAACADGCSPEAALASGVANNTLFRYNPVDGSTVYEAVTESDALTPWAGYWVAALPGVESIQWLLPAGDSPQNELPATLPEPTSEELARDAARLLMQASFGPTKAAIDEVLALGGPSEWIADQLAKTPSSHLAEVRANFPDEEDDQEARYRTFWKLVINSEDQLRQRVAYGLSQIFVISDNSSATDDHSNLLAAYYDVLVNGAFGNYRDLLENVTLSPAMGVYLSMLGNDKPDEETGRRADENYAREMMQLFSIGLVGLNSDGSEQPGIITYDQGDVEALARVFTGWSWDVGKWETSASNGWKPDRRTMEIPMVSFPDRHDTDVKQFLGTTISAGQSAEDDMKMVLDRVFWHPNVGPFISKQLIKRLVTSNPSPGYVARVANMFNDNGSGVRGDLSSVVRAILLDREARDMAISERNISGKLRESLLRYAHVLRAFDAEGTFEIKSWLKKRFPQVAPLTAKSVFNFYSPDYAPPGPLTDANLVAPEFQLNSESNVNLVNEQLARILIRGQFLAAPVNLTLTEELELLDDALQGDPSALIDHLDLVLTAGTLTEGSRNLLAEYINANSERVDRDRLLEDVITLVVTSTEFAIQR